MDYLKSLMAGGLIGLCCDMYNRIGGVVGAVLFAIGLLTICLFELPLFTGRVGGSSDMKGLTAILVLNLEGIGIVKALFMLDDIIVLGIACGVLVQIAVSAYKKGMPILTIMCVAGFILSGYKHCIACGYYDIELIPMIKIIAGNAIGAKIAYYGGIRDISNFNKE